MDSCKNVFLPQSIWTMGLPYNLLHQVLQWEGSIINACISITFTFFPLQSVNTILASNFCETELAWLLTMKDLSQYLIVIPRLLVTPFLSTVAIFVHLRQCHFSPHLLMVEYHITIKFTQIYFISPFIFPNNIF